MRLRKRTIRALTRTSRRFSPIALVKAVARKPDLRMEVHAPPRLPAGRPLVVVLHGCAQTALGFARDAGWMTLAERMQFALVLPEQSMLRHGGRCFQWFEPTQTRRGRSEAGAIRRMITEAAGRFGSDKRRIYIAGFSAGGGMTAAMLAAYPAVFAGAGIMAGAPFGCAGSAAGALAHMHRANVSRPREALADEVRRVAGARARWPRVSIWQGEADRTVDPANAVMLAAQWSALHGFGEAPTEVAGRDGMRRAVWGRPGRPGAVELWTLAGWGHAFPVDTRGAGVGRRGAFVEDAGLSAAAGMAAFWGIAQEESGSFLKKRTRKLLSVGVEPSGS